MCDITEHVVLIGEYIYYGYISFTLDISRQIPMDILKLKWMKIYKEPICKF